MEETGISEDKQSCSNEYVDALAIINFILINFITHVFSVGPDHQAVSEPGSIRDRVRVTFLQ